MRYLIISDIHSNHEALSAVLISARGEFDEIACCGDLVGYGPEPDSVTDWVRENVRKVIRGNHDRVCSGMGEAREFNEAARVAAYWTGSQMKPENLEYLRQLPTGSIDIDGHFSIYHGSPRDEDEYVTVATDAAECFPLMSLPLAFFGHTHLQGGFLKTARGNVMVLPTGVPPESAMRLLEIREGESYYINPGSVGQPRDRDPRAAFAIYDTKGYIEFRRVAYDIDTTVRKMQEAELPEFLSYRLTLGR